MFEKLALQIRGLRDTGPKGDPSIARIEKLIEQHKLANYDRVDELVYIDSFREGLHIRTEQEFKIVVGFACLNPKLSGCLMRVRCLCQLSAVSHIP